MCGVCARALLCEHACTLNYVSSMDVCSVCTFLKGLFCFTKNYLALTMLVTNCSGSNNDVGTADDDSSSSSRRILMLSQSSSDLA